MSRILCIDDEAAVLARGGYHAVGASDGRSALVLLGQGGIDAVLLDLGLPDREGLELLGAIRGIADIPVIVVSARRRTVARPQNRCRPLATAIDLQRAGDRLPVWE
ncbi:response regulator transcription factor [Novosphingobium sp. AAP83]|uniref:response regulator transcription factor n=1 Tax=Novosphingobium sp. AAP83 TaxID=1523425 RepID=UPI0006B9E131|nr:response regulator [Novosphingobium sp. AAP83]